MSYNLKAEFDDMFFNGAQKREAKKKLNEFYDRFGENKRAIEDGTTMSEYMEYVMASAYADEVLKERREARMMARNNTSLMLRNHGQDMRDDMAKRREEFELSILRGENTKENDEELSMSEEVKKVTEDKELEEKQKAELSLQDKRSASLSLAIKTKKYKETDKFNYLIQSIFDDEGGYEDNPKKIDQPTNMGITQGTLNRFNIAHPEFRIDKKLRDLTSEDAKLIYNLDYYHYYRIEEINNVSVAKLMLHLYVNNKPRDVGKIVQKTLIDMDKKVALDGLVGSDTIKMINQLEQEGKSDLFKRKLSQKRIEFEEKLRDSHKYPGRKKRFERLGQ